MAEPDDLNTAPSTRVPEDMATIRVTQPAPSAVPQDLQTVLVAKPAASPTQAAHEAASPMGANPAAPVPFVFGRRIAQGGMGAIIEASDCKLGRTIAVKVMLSEAGVSEEQKQRFIQEAAVLGKLEHPNIVPIHDLGLDSEGQLFYTMKLVKGRTLQHILDELRREHPEDLREFTLDRLLTIFRKVCDALAFAHSKGIIHRDLKPENIMVGEFGEVLVMDWGLAKILGEHSQTEAEVSARPPFPTTTGSLTATMDGAVMGTPNYMSPEQAMGKVNEMDARSDIFSLGGILYCILTLRPPVEGKDVWEVLEKVSSAHITAPTLFGATVTNGKASAKSAVLDAKKIKPLPHMPGEKVPPALSAVAMKALTLDKAKRYQNMAAFSADIEKYQGGFATSAENAGAWKQLKLLVGRHKAVAAGIAAVLLVGATFGTKAVVEGRRAEREAARAKAALADLKKQAPALLALAEAEAGFQRFDSALEKLDAALALDPALTTGWWRRAWLLLTQEKFAESAEAVRAAQARDPAQAVRLGAILPLLGELAAAPPAERWTPARSSAVLAHLKATGAGGEVVALSSRFQLSVADKKKIVEARLKEWLGNSPFLGDSTDGSIGFSLPKTVDTLEPLRGLPLNHLKIDSTSVTNLEPLRGMQLRTLSVGLTRVTDLSPLRGMALTELNSHTTGITDLSPLADMPLTRLVAGKTSVEDLTPLRGMPLQALTLEHTKVHDLTPLAGMPLHSLNVQSTRVADLSPLRGMALESLNAAGLKTPVDVSPLRGMPLQRLQVTSADYAPLVGIEFDYLDVGTVTQSAAATLKGIRTRSLRIVATNVRDLTVLPHVRFKLLKLEVSYAVRDLTPLRECAEMEELDVNSCPAPIEPLRGHQSLQRLAYSRPGEPPCPVLPVEKFWAEYDARQSADKN